MLVRGGGGAKPGPRRASVRRCMFVFFFSSRRRHTRFDCDWSSDVCSSDLNVNPGSGGFKIGTANITSPTLTVAGHTTVTGGGLACASCHETAPYLGMLPSKIGRASCRERV